MIGVTPVKAVHVVELRNALHDIHVDAGLTPPGFSEGAVVVGVIRALHINELRAAVRTLGDQWSPLVTVTAPSEGTTQAGGTAVVLSASATVHGALCRKWLSKRSGR